MKDNYYQHLQLPSRDEYPLSYLEYFNRYVVTAYSSPYLEFYNTFSGMSYLDEMLNNRKAWHIRWRVSARAKFNLLLCKIYAVCANALKMSK